MLDGFGDDSPIDGTASDSASRSTRSVETETIMDHLNFHSTQPVSLELVLNPFVVVIGIVNETLPNIKTEIQHLQNHVSDKDGHTRGQIRLLG